MKKAYSLMEFSAILLIIGVFVAAILQGIKIIDSARLTNARVATKDSGIEQIPNMVAWYETTLQGSLVGANPNRKKFVKDSDFIAGWKDLNTSAAAHDLSQTAISHQPSYSQNAISKLPALKFNGSNYFQTINLVGNNFSLFTVIQTTNPGSGLENDLAWKSSPIISADKDLVYFDIIPLSIGGGKPKIGTGDTNDGDLGGEEKESVLVGSASVNDNKPHVIMTSRNQTNGLRAIYLDGTQIAVSAKSVGKLNASGARCDNPTMTIGSKNSAYNGYLGEVIIFDRVLNPSEQKMVEAYLAKKWSIQLPS